MNLDHAQPHTTTSHQRPRHTDTHLHGGWLMLARIVWGVLVLFTLGIFIVSVPESFATLHMPCPAVSCTSTTGQLTAGDIQTLQKSGLSLDAYTFYWIALNIGVALGWFLISGVLTWRKSDDWMVLLVALTLVSAGSVSLSTALVFSSSIWQLAANGWYLVSSLALLFTFALFPNGRFVPRWIGWILLVYPAQLVCYLVFLRQLHLPRWSLYQNPLTAFAWFGCLGALALAQLYRYLRMSNQVERQQTKWVAFSFLVLMVTSFGDTAVENLLSIQQIGLLYVLITSLFTCMILAVPLSLAVAILRYRLWDIDIIINRALVYSILTVSIIGFYVLVVGYLGAAFHTGSNLLISLIATGLVAVLFQPLRELLQRGVNRLLYGQRDEPYRVITRLGQRMEATLAPDAVLSAIVETVAQALKLPYSAIALRHDQAFSIAASYGTEVEMPLHVPLMYQTEQVGELLLAPRARGEVFTPADHRLLDDLARQVGVAVHAVRLTADLQLSRERLVNTREEERRRLRRDLHDGLGPALASLTLKLDAARNLLLRDPPAADALLVDLKKQTQTAIADIRRLVYELRPPTLDELGLVSALREQAEQYTHDGLNIMIDAPEQLPSLPAAVEVATYRIVQEAVTNVVRHAQARTCTIHVALDGGLCVEVRDDGRGIQAGHRAGVGLTSIRERTAELGGTCEIEPIPSGGTRVYVRLPLPKE